MWTDLDVFICNMGQVNELFWNSGDGTLVHDTGTTLRVGGNPDFNAVVADIDRDGDFDIVTAGFITPNRVFRFVHCPIGGSAKSTTGGQGCLTRCPGYSKRALETLDACIECPEHMAASAAGGCGYCPPGQERGFGVDECTACEMGSRQESTGTYCEPCSAGSYSPEPGGLPTCSACAPGGTRPSATRRSPRSPSIGRCSAS